MPDLEKYIRDIPDFPKKGIIFKDITPLLKEPAAFAEVVRLIAEKFEGKGITSVLGAEARGFIFGAAVALEMGVSFLPVRKPGKLPYSTEAASYELEYGTDSLEIHTDAIAKGEKVLLVDDLLATGGTMAACCELVERVGGEVGGIAFVIKMEILKGREKITKYDPYCLIKY